MISLRYLEYLCARDYDKRRLLELLRNQLDSIEYSINDIHELDFLANYALQDFMHYIYAKKGFYLRKNFDEKKARLKLCGLVVYKEDKVKKLISDWLSWWVIKWKQRVRITFNDNQNKKVTNEMKIIETMINNIKPKLRDYYKRLSICSLIEVGEICSLDIIADYLLRSCISSLITKYGENRTYSILNLRPDLVKIEIIKKAVELSRINQPLVVLRLRLTKSHEEYRW